MFLGLVASPLLATPMEMPRAPRPPIAAAPAQSIDSNVRHDVVARLSDALRNNYVFPDVGEKAAEKVGASLAAGEYDQLSDAISFAARLSSDVAAIAHDKHLQVFSQSAPPGPPPGAGGDMPPLAEGGVARADKLAGGVGYIEVVGFPPLPVFKPTLDKAMVALKGSRALIIDDRRNGGGSPDGVAYLVSFLVPPTQTVEISDIVSRVPKTKTFKRERHSSQPTPVSLAGIPVYVLTSKDTFSGGEELAYDLQATRRARIVGEVTGGGANPNEAFDLGGGFVAYVPNGAAINPITRTNWEGAGVAPDVRVDAVKAQASAQRLALEAALAQATDDAERASIREALVAMVPFARSEDPITKTNWEGRGVQPDVPVAAGDALKVALETLGQKPVAEIQAASVKQVFAPRSAALPGTEAALRSLVSDLAAGKPNYSAMTPDLADLMRQQLPQLQGQLSQLGALQKMRFRRPMMGGDEFVLSFAHGKALMAIMLNPDGKIENALPPLPISGDE